MNYRRPLLCTALMAALSSVGSAATRVDLSEAEALVRADIFKTITAMNPAATFPLHELTTDEMWERLGAQIYEINDGIYEPGWYAIVDREAVSLATGTSVVPSSMCLADIDHDGNHELLFIYYYGCGVLRAALGMFSPQYDVSHILISCLDPGKGSWALDKHDDATVWISNGDVLLGQVILEGKGQQRCLRIQDSGEPAGSHRAADR